MDGKYEVNIEKYRQKKVLREIIKIGETKSEVLTSDWSRFVRIWQSKGYNLTCKVHKHSKQIEKERGEAQISC